MGKKKSDKQFIEEAGLPVNNKTLISSLANLDTPAKKHDYLRRYKVAMQGSGTKKPSKKRGGSSGASTKKKPKLGGDDDEFEKKLKEMGKSELREMLRSVHTTAKSAGEGGKAGEADPKSSGDGEKPDETGKGGATDPKPVDNDVKPPVSEEKVEEVSPFSEEKFDKRLLAEIAFLPGFTTQMRNEFLHLCHRNKIYTLVDMYGLGIRMGHGPDDWAKVSTAFDELGAGTVILVHVLWTRAVSSSKELFGLAEKPAVTTVKVQQENTTESDGAKKPGTGNIPAPILCKLLEGMSIDAHDMPCRELLSLLWNHKKVMSFPANIKLIFLASQSDADDRACAKNYEDIKKCLKLKDGMLQSDMGEEDMADLSYIHYRELAEKIGFLERACVILKMCDPGDFAPHVAAIKRYGYSHAEHRNPELQRAEHRVRIEIANGYFTAGGKLKVALKKIYPEGATAYYPAEMIWRRLLIDVPVENTVKYKRQQKKAEEEQKSTLRNLQNGRGPRGDPEKALGQGSQADPEKEAKATYFKHCKEISVDWFKNRRPICMAHNSPQGCPRDEKDCRNEHACPVCGQKGCSLQKHKANLQLLPASPAGFPSMK